MKLEIAGSTDPGRRREHNEDVIWWRQSAPEEGETPTGVMIVADGMGGAAAGEVASRTAVDKFVETLASEDGEYSKDSLRRAIEASSASVFRLSEENPKYQGMGTTMCVAVVRDDKLLVGHVGDSRCYLVRNGRTRQITADHTWVAEEVKLGRMTPEEAKQHPNRHVISRSVGVGPSVDIDTYGPIELEDGDVIVLCSDGLSDVVTPREAGELASQFAPEDAVQRLIDLANSRGGPDNISVVIARVGAPVPVTTEEETVKIGSLARPRRKRTPAVLAGAVASVAGIAFLIFLIQSGGGDGTKSSAQTISSSSTVDATTTPGLSNSSSSGSPIATQGVTLAECATYLSYAVKSGETLNGLALAAGLTDPDKIAKWESQVVRCSHLPNKNTVATGQIIYCPADVPCESEPSGGRAGGPQ